MVWVWSVHRNSRLTRELADTHARYTAALHQQQATGELFRTLFDAAPECIKLQDAEGRIERINAAGLALLETNQPSRVVGESVFNIIAPEYHEAYRRLTADVFSGCSRFMEFELTTFRGRRRWLETHAAPLRGEQGQIVGLMAVTRDIDERRYMTQQLEEQRNRLHTVIESEPECVKLHDHEGKILEMNPAGLALLNAKNPEQVIGRSVYEFLDADYHEAYRQLTEDVFNGERRNMEFEVKTIDGKHRWLETHAAPLLDSNGQVSALLAITRDIDQRKHTEEKLRRQRNELAHVCRLSTLGELASGLAHELNQPLCALSSYAETARALQHQGDPANRQRIDRILLKIVHETERAHGIIQRLREYVRKRTPQPRPHAVTHLIDGVLDIIEPECRQQHIRIDLATQDGLPPVLVDRVQTEQVLLNLINNALQASVSSTASSDKLELSVSFHNDAVCIALRDFADGIPEDLRSQLFTPFFTTKRDGIGMGLALSRSIAESYGGQLVYEPANPGSIFRLLLPTGKPGP